jgi:hypothetical protein
MLFVSLRGNFLYGYSLGQSDEKRLLFGWANVAADIWKAFGLIAVALLWRAKRRRAVLGASVAWLMCLVFGINSALGIYAQDRATLIGGKQAAHATYAEAQEQLASIEDRLRAYPRQRSTAVIDADIGAVLARSIITGERWRGTVGTLSQQCARLDARTRSACDEIHALRRERAAAKEVESLEELASELRGRVAALRDQGNSLAPDPLAEFYTWLTRGFVDPRDVGFGFPLFFALLIEAVSAFGPVTIAAYADASRNLRSGTLPRAMTGHDAPWRAAAGQAATCDADVLLWIAERAVPGAGNRGIGLAKLYVDYAAWCGEHEIEAASNALFERAFDAARQLPELSGKIRKFGDRYYGIGLVQPRSIAAR